MATILLQAAGGALGGLVGGPLGAVAGRALGALGGYAIDSRLAAKSQLREGPRLGANRILEADEGGGVARLYGTARIAGQVIWTTRFEEMSTTERQGGKGTGGGTETKTYSYFGNVAIGLCEGPVACVRRIWADGEEMDLSLVNWRLHRGDETQGPDPLIEAKQGRGNVPAYRGLAYVVFERLALERWGNRIPQIACEVLRPVGELEEGVRAITVIPGATEHGLDPLTVRETLRPGEDRLPNRNILHAGNDITASLNELTALCPRLERVALVVSWFADDLRAGRASVRPGVEIGARRESVAWNVGGTERDGARLVSRSDGGPAYGGTPSDAGVVRAIQMLRARGLKVTHYPFLLMDVPADNALTDPYGEARQAAYPWRGRMTLDTAPGRAGSADGTAGARAEIARFVGTARPEHFTVSALGVRYGGPAEWSYRRMVLHQAHLARFAGGVDAFVIGSEMRGLTRVRDEAGRFPFVEALVALAREVKAILPGALVTYAADWSEYFGYQPADGSGDVLFNLDALWADPAIGAVGIDNYLPLSDWREGDAQAGGRDGMRSPYDVEGLRSGIAGGEHFDWYYASDADRRAARRTVITDGLGKPWVFRVKDLRSWWETPHFDRRGGVESATATAWVPRSKPIWFTELGCPAVDAGANQPNVFVDPKSAESALPHFSTGARDDLAQRRFLEAHHRHWDPAAPGFREADNPVSPLYGGRMVTPDAVHLWCWDARPAPAFPERSDIWRDGGNWERGHWLSGRLGRAPLDALIARLLRDHGFTDFDVREVDGEVGGYLVPGPGSARSELEELMRLMGIEAWTEAGILRFRSLGRAGAATSVGALVDVAERSLLEIRRAEPSDAVEEVVIGFSDPARAYQSAAADAALGTAGQPRQGTVELPVVLAETQARALAEALLLRGQGERETASFELSPAEIALGLGDRITLPGTAGRWQIERIEDGATRRVDVRRVASEGVSRPVRDEPAAARPRPVGPVMASRPVVHLLDLPRLAAFADGEGARVAVAARPWLPYDVLSSTTGTGFERRMHVSRRATLGWLAEPLAPGSPAFLDRSGRIVVDLLAGALASVTPADMLAGANLAAVQGPAGDWEVVQFESAEEIVPGRFALAGLVRGLGGSEPGEMASAGAAFVLLDAAVLPISLLPTEVGSERHWLTVPAGRGLDDDAVDRRVASLGRRTLLPLAPVHARGAFEADGALRLSWIRRTRAPGDGWDGIDVPLGEERELYHVRLTGGGADISLETGEPRLVLSSDEVASSFGRQPGPLAASVSQLGMTPGPGAPCRFEIPRRR
ncbi:glycoside hydrolase/phage tail family protein [Aureimonas sp. AU12]|uniref:baseplate multidomain protein megatron n=1 Tax=Aureimonas sp. AU12 TaxID=1638161 RepID=UPI000785D5AA|nr:glycoside hydrolase/phage tail family protein [Aureimonas sp. AU12]